MFKIITAVIIFLSSVITLSAQYNFHKEQDLKQNAIYSRETQTTQPLNFNLERKKSVGISAILSVLLPGAGHFYIDRMDAGKYFFAAEVTSWLGIIGLTTYGNAVRNDARSYSIWHSGLNKSGKDDDFFINVGNFNSVFEYNQDALRRGEYEKLYDEKTHFWNWDLNENRETYNFERKRSERIYNTRIVFYTSLIINRIISGISAIILTNKHNKTITSLLKLNPSLTLGKDNRIDGFRINFNTNF